MNPGDHFIGSSEGLNQALSSYGSTAFNVYSPAPPRASAFGARSGNFKSAIQAIFPPQKNFSKAFRLKRDPSNLPTSKKLLQSIQVAREIGVVGVEGPSALRSRPCRRDTELHARRRDLCVGGNLYVSSHKKQNVREYRAPCCSAVLLLFFGKGLLREVQVSRHFSELTVWCMYRVSRCLSLVE
jgi:hypothetical protein